jgi:hypothetical protein
LPVNNYGALWFTAFLKEQSYGCVDDDCMTETRGLLVFIFGAHMAKNLVEMGKPMVSAWFQHKAEAWAKRAAQKEMGATPNPDAAQQDAVFLRVVEMEGRLTDSTDTTYEDYSEMVLQFGFVTMFVSALPILPLFALLENTIEIRVDAFKMCRLVTRPFPEAVEDIGTWDTFMLLMNALSMATNIGMIVFTADTKEFSGLSSSSKLNTFLVALVLCIAVSWTVWNQIRDVPRNVQKRRARNIHVENKHKLGEPDAVIQSDSEDEDDEEQDAIMASAKNVAGELHRFGQGAMKNTAAFGGNAAQKVKRGVGDVGSATKNIAMRASDGILGRQDIMRGRPGPNSSQEAKL